MINVQRVTPDNPRNKELTELVLELHELVADKIHNSQLRRRTRNVEDAFLVVAGHIVFAIAARRTELNGVPIPMLINDLTAVIEVNAMEMHKENY